MNLHDLHFIRPYWCWALLPWLIILLWLIRHKLSQGNWSKVCDEALLPYILQQKNARLAKMPLIVGALASLLAIIALAGPTWERLPLPVFRNDSALVIALDLSLSMNAADVKPRRLIRARYKIADILKQRSDGQTALLVYAGDAFTVTPLTDDTGTISSQLSVLTTDIMPSQGNNSRAALQQAKQLLKQAGFQQGDVLWITGGHGIDFEMTKTAIKALGAYSLSILGVGTETGAPIQVATGGFVKDRRGNIVVPKLDAGRLAQLAATGHGMYRTITDDDRDISALTAYFDSKLQADGAEQSDLRLQQWAEQGPWLVLLILPLAALFFRKGLLSIALLLLLPFPEKSYALEWQDLWQTQDQQAQKAYQAQQFDAAAGQFQNPQWRAAAQYQAGHYDQVVETLQGIETADSFYNQGNALAQSGQLEQALKAYDKALAIDPENENARYNKDIVEKELKEQHQKNDQKQENDQQDPQNSAQDKPGETSEQPEDSKPSDKSENGTQQSSGQDSQTEPQNQSNTEQADTDKAGQEQAEQNPQQEKPQAAPSAGHKPLDETEQANEQWLNRIPDDPGGLLRRKFLYQYGQRGRQSETR
ncbi:MAG: hypothetical protein CVV13_09350 [Gammaproteobacteria bacterium HGW-Gammaproteobacteria-3]|nr:MAG: hypothetical protein CVV13_09350 [Gammaproteobacteria bacterium HGW-Gammaproteobacteria-3]